MNNFIKILSEEHENNSHYKTETVECIDALKACMTNEEFRGFCAGNIIKYIWRLNKKNTAIENAEKAQYYLNTLLRELKNAKID